MTHVINTTRKYEKSAEACIEDAERRKLEIDTEKRQQRRQQRRRSVKRRPRNRLSWSDGNRSWRERSQPSGDKCGR
jgi:hypothetical protein